MFVRSDTKQICSREENTEESASDRIVYTIVND